MPMAEVIRKIYLDRLLSGRGRPDTVKIITGMRRSGKTVLMKQYMDLLRGSGVPDSQMIYLNFESRALAHVTDHLKLLEEIDKKYSGRRTYVFLDEVQTVKHWEKAVSSLQTDYDADIYIAGSNADLLPDYLSACISGRYTELRILPLSFKEFLELHPGDREDRLRQYVITGSLPAADPDADEMFENDHLIGLFNTVLLNDVVGNCRGGDVGTLTEIVRFLYSNIGNMTSANNIAVTIKKNPEKVRSYLDALQKAFLIYKAGRYDIRGKRRLDTLEKYYVPDTGMRNAVLGASSGEDISRQIENIVYLELLRRGYEVAVGKYGSREVDFVVRRGCETQYFQVTMSMMAEDAYEREIAPFRLIRDSYPKTVLSMDTLVTDLPDGIQHSNLLDWLLDEYRGVRGRDTA